MPAKSPEQRRTACMVMRSRQGKAKLPPRMQGMMKDMSDQDLKDMCTMPMEKK